MKALKKGVRILGIDDSPFTKTDSHVLVVGVVERNGTVEGVLSTVVERDGDDATERILEMVSRSRFLSQVKAIMLNSIMMGGFNVVDISALHEKTGKPIIAVVRRKPDMEQVKKALSNVCCAEEKMAKIKRAGKVYRFGRLYAQLAGIKQKEAGEILGRYRGVPEAVRLAHIIAGGIIRGESRGKA